MFNNSTSKNYSGGVRFLIVFAVTVLFLFIAIAVAAETDAKITGSMEKGKAVYAKYCQGCHGEKGDGRGAAGEIMNPRPTDFTNKAVMTKVKDETILTIITNGGQVMGLFGMAPWKDKLSAEQIQDAAAYIRTFAK